MSLTVIGAGFGRTGTMSLKLALEQLGFGPCHHMEEVFQNPDQLPHWQAAAIGEPVDWHSAFANYRSAVDWPTAHYWRELATLYPDSKVVLSVRPAERWWQSFSDTIKAILEMHETIPDPHPRAVAAMACKIIAEQTFNGAMADKDAALAAFQKRIDDVTSALPPDRVLVFDVAEGWAPLCAFLDCAVPDADFPRSNSTEEFWQIFGPDAAQ